MSDFFLVFYAWKCMNCGALIDKTIARNRRNSAASKSPDFAKVADKSSANCSSIGRKELPTLR
jgi:hypothetical protein